MSDLDKFYQLAKNIVNYPYDKAVYYREGWIRKIDVYPNWPLNHETITFHNYPDLVGTKGIDVMLNSCWIRVDTDDSVYINDIIDLIKNHCNEKVKAALLEGIE